MDTTAAVARIPGAQFNIETLTVDAPGPGEILVRIAGVGVCHTDLIFRDQFVPYPLPAVLGHEGSGTIEAIGEGVAGLAIGDRVVIGFSSCGDCPNCDAHLPSYCRDFSPLNLAGGRADGTTAFSAGAEKVASHFFGQSSFAAHAVVHARNVVRIDDPDVPLELLGPLGCGFQTGAGAVMRSMACPAGSSLAVFGGGPVGLAAVMAAVVQGCRHIILVEPLAVRRALALELGATAVIDPADGDVAAAIREHLPDGVEFAFDTSGRIEVIKAALRALANRGMLGLVGLPGAGGGEISLNIAGLITFGHRIIGIMEGDSDPPAFIPELVALFSAGRFPIDRLIRTWPLAEINQAIDAQARGECVKVVLIPELS